LALASNTWMLKEKIVDKAAVDELIDGYNSCRINTFLDMGQKAAEQLADPAKNDRLELVTADGKQIAAFGKGDGTNISIHLEGKDEIYKVGIEFFNKFVAAKTAIQKTLEPETPKPVPASAPVTTPAATATISPVGANSSAPDAKTPDAPKATPGADASGNHSGQDHSGHDHD